MMTMGAALLLGALALLLYNRQEATQAEQAAAQRLAELTAEVEAAEPSGGAAEPPLASTPLALRTPEDLEMAEVTIDGNAYIGWLDLPTLGVRLPVQSEWSYPGLRVSPCRYAGTVLGEDLVILAHNYSTHFGGLKNLSVGDAVFFTDVHGTTYAYAVAELDVLEPTDVEAVTGSGYPLTLFTCTYGGASRVTAYCTHAASQ